MASSGFIVDGLEVPIHVINLDSRPDRWEAIERQLAAQGLTAQRIAALTGQDARDRGYRLCVPAQEQPEWRVGDGAFGCAASHIEAYRLIAASEAPGALVLEDDAVLVDDFTTRASLALQSRSSQSSLVSFGWTFYGWTVRGRIAEAAHRLRGLGPRDRLAVQPFEMGAHCYWVSHEFSAAATELMSPVFAPIDAMLRALTHYASWQAEVHWPPLATQDATDSDIQLQPPEPR